MKVSELMTEGARTVPPERRLKDVAAMLADYRIGGVPVVDEGGAPLGVVTKTDIVIKERGEIPQEGWRRWFGGGNGAELVAVKVHARTAGEAMTSPAITVPPEMPVAIAAERMISYGVNRLPVVRRDRVVGIIARHDLVRMFSRDDAEIEREIREEAMKGLAWPEAIDVSVHDGEVTLRGQADSMLDAELLPATVRHILGVVSVDAELNALNAPGGERRQTVKTVL